MSQEMKRCRVCDKVKPLTEFGISRAEKAGISATCLSCNRERYARYRERHALGLTVPYGGKSDEERFWEKVDKAGDCWIWQAGRMPFGYGRFKVNGRNMSAHRYAWELVNGKVPDGMVLCHHCDNPPCVRPDHLFLGTYKDNTQDAVRKGRMPHKLIDAQVRTIRERFASGEITHTALAAIYGVSRKTIFRIVTNQTWKHLLDNERQDHDS